MKSVLKRLSAVTLLLLLITALTIPSSAATDWSTVKLEEYILIFNSYVETSDTVMAYGFTCMRGFTVSPDGKYAFGGFLNPGGTSAVTMFDLSTALPLDSYIHDQADNSRSYPKGLAVDDRGYLYVGLAYYPNYGSADFSVVKYTDNGELTEVSYTNILTIGTPGDKSGKKMGINGADVQKIGNKYYAYFVVNYDVDFLYRFDVTDPQKPVLDTTFGTEGRVDIAAKYSFSEGQYLDVDTDGTIYLCGSTATDAGMYIFSADGNTLLNHYACANGYAVGLWEDYIFVTTSKSPVVIHVLDKITLAEVATITGHDGANSYVYVTAVDGVLYVADQASSATDYDGIIVAPLTADGSALLSQRKASIAANLAAAQTTTGVPVTTPSAATTTKAPASTTATTTISPATDAATAALTTAAGTAAVTEPEKSSGCGSSLALTFLIPAALIPALITKKKKE